jgi:CheY-like chemotaxis protein
LILSDINMPGMSGLEFLPKAKAARPDVPFQGERPSGPAFIIWSIPTKRTPADAAAKPAMLTEVDMRASMSKSPGGHRGGDCPRRCFLKN